MKSIKRIYNPKHVYQGWFEAYFIRPWVRLYADFRSSETGRDFLYSLLAWVIISMGLAGLLMGLVGLLGPDVGFTALKIVGSIWGLLSLIPFIALLARTFNGQGDRTPQKARMLGIDILQIAACLLFFIFGLLMMTTTMHSEILHGDTGDDEADTTKLEFDSVVEEPIFTYQDTHEVIVEDSSMIEEEQTQDPDMISPEESYDPTIDADPDLKNMPDTVNYF